MTKRKENSIQVSEAIFHAIAAMVNRLVFISEDECSVAPVSLLILWHVRHNGKVHLNDQTFILRQELTRMLKGKFRYTDGDISKLLAKLQDDGFIVRSSISSQERVKLFGSRGDTRVVILNAQGKAKIEEFKNILRGHADKWLSEQSSTTRLAIRALLPAIEKLARWLVGRYEPERMATLYPLKTKNEAKA